MRVLSAWIGICLLCAPTAAAAGEFSGTVVEAVAADTLRVMAPGGTIEVRLFGVACPRPHQPFAAESLSFVKKAALAKRVTVKAKGLDPSGRTLGWATLPGDIELNRELVRQGLAWVSPHDDNEALMEVQAAAREAKRGLWAEENPVPPWKAEAEKAKSEVKGPEAKPKTGNPPAKAVATWRIAIDCRKGETPDVELIADSRSISNVAARSKNFRGLPAFAGPLVSLPGPGKYEAAFRMALEEERQYSNYVSRAEFLVLPESETDFDAKRCRPLAREVREHSLLSPKYKEYKVEFEVAENGLKVRPVAWKAGMVVRFDRVVIRRLPETEEATAPEIRLRMIE